MVRSAGASRMQGLPASGDVTELSHPLSSSAFPTPPVCARAHRYADAARMGHPSAQEALGLLLLKRAADEAPSGRQYDASAHHAITHQASSKGDTDAPPLARTDAPANTVEALAAANEAWRWQCQASAQMEEAELWLRRASDQLQPTAALALVKLYVRRGDGLRLSGLLGSWGGRLLTRSSKSSTWESGRLSALAVLPLGVVAVLTNVS